MKKILVPTDFSTFADSALKIAIALAQKFEAEVHLLNVMLTPDNALIDANESHTNISIGGDNGYLVDVVENVKQNCQKLVEGCGYEKAVYQITSGNISQAIVSYAEKQNIDLIVMGTQGEGGYDAIFVGSNAEKVVRLAPCPVITARKAPEDLDFKHIVYATDFNKKSQVAIEKLKQFHKVFGGELHLLYVNTPARFKTSKDLQSQVEEFAKTYELESYEFEIYCDFVEEDGITHFAESIDADLIAVASRHRVGFARLLAGSVSEGVVNVSNIPVLTLSLG